jgi:hypothetical protein
MPSDITPLGEPEVVGKLVDAALDVAKDALKPLAQNVVGLATDAVYEYRLRRFVTMRQKTLKQLSDGGVSELIEPPAAVAIPLLDAATLENREELQDLWASLLANLMDPAHCDLVRIEFVDTLKQLNPIDAKCLELLNTAVDSTQNPRNHLSGLLSVDPGVVQVALENLAKLGCANAAGIGANSGIFLVSAYGRQLFQACRGG